MKMRAGLSFALLFSTFSAAAGVDRAVSADSRFLDHEESGGTDSFVVDGTLPDYPFNNTNTTLIDYPIQESMEAVVLSGKGKGSSKSSKSAKTSKKSGKGKGKGSKSSKKSSPFPPAHPPSGSKSSKGGSGKGGKGAPTHPPSKSLHLFRCLTENPPIFLILLLF